MPPDPGSAAWSDARAYRDEYERLRGVTEHLARAVAELTRAAALVGDHTAAVPLRDALERLQLLQAQLATASEKAYSFGQLAARRARHEALQRQVDEATGSAGPPLEPPEW